MALQVIAYSGLRVVRSLGSTEDPSAVQDGITFQVHPGFPRQAGGIDPQLVYSAQQTFRFDVGSYSRYLRWLEQLARVVGIPSIDLFWRSPKPIAFAELLDFADCNATMGSVTCAKLAHDFQDWAVKAARSTESYFREQYAFWGRACDIAALHGCISLHSKSSAGSPHASINSERA